MSSKYYLVLFTNSESHKEIDIVPASWLTYDYKNETCHCKFMPGPYDMGKFKQLQAMVKRCEDPLPDWSEFPIEIRGRASKSQNPLIKIKNIYSSYFIR